MICKPCACDADFQIGDPDPYSKYRDEGLGGHGACKGCDCQHKPVKAGQIVNE